MHMFAFIQASLLERNPLLGVHLFLLMEQR
jgi:hypothetical protein